MKQWRSPVIRGISARYIHHLLEVTLKEHSGTRVSVPEHFTYNEEVRETLNIFCKLNFWQQQQHFFKK